MGVKYTVRHLEKEDISSVAELEKLCFCDPWSENSLCHLLGKDAFGLVAISPEGRIAGYVGIWLSPNEGQITNIATHPDFRRSGIAKSLLDVLFEEAKTQRWEQISLEVRVSNLPAITLYEKAGFERAGLRKHFYHHPTEDALVMLRSFPSQTV